MVKTSQCGVHETDSERLGRQGQNREVCDTIVLTWLKNERGDTLNF